MTHLTKELRSFAALLGRRASGMTEIAAAEFDEIAEHKLAAKLGMAVSDPQFQAIWSAVLDLSYGFIEGDDEDELTLRHEVPNEHDLAGLPYVDFFINIYVPGADRYALVEARTGEEAWRTISAEHPKATSYSVVNLARCPKVRAGAKAEG
jgi:hypothetical protein